MACPVSDVHTCIRILCSPTLLQDQLILTEWAQELGGMTAVLEHRYFGESLPFGNESYTSKNLRYFTLENVMADAVSFVDFVKKNVTGAAHSKVIVVGGASEPPCTLEITEQCVPGSYGGFLAAAFRQNYPDTFFGAWSVAGPFRAWGDAKEAGSEGYNWFDYVRRSPNEQSNTSSDTRRRLRISTLAARSTRSLE